MNQTAFNLLDEKWIRVMKPDAEAEEVSLTDALVHAHLYTDLAGELPAQDVATLRLLLAVVHTVFSRVDEAGKAEEIESVQGALKRWQALWRLGHFPEAPIRAYLADWHERFWLFHPERPFYQVNEAAMGTESKASKLNGEISQSGNKERLFSMRSGEQKEKLTYAEAARWLLYVNAYDDNAGKPKGKNLPTPGIGWLGKLGLITAEGNNLFETLQLNMVLLPNRRLWEEPEKPCWELEKSRSGERVQIAIPHNAAELLTLQSRRILLRHQDDAVTGYTLLGGDFFPAEDATQEQMTVWRDVRENDVHQCFKPKQHDMTKQMWRDFETITAASEGSLRPGVVSWVTLLQTAHLLDGRKRISFRIASVQYGDKNFFVKHVFDDRLSFHTELLTEVGAVGYAYALAEIKNVDKAAGYIGQLADDLYMASGGRHESNADEMKARFYDAVDAPFRLWLASLDPEAGAELLLMKQMAWRVQAKRLAKRLGEQMIAGAGRAAFVGRTVTVKRGKTEEERHFSSPEAARSFRRHLNQLYPDNQETEGGK